MVSELITKAQEHGNGGLKIYIPAKLRVDSQNPIQAGDLVKITVDGKRMIIEPQKEVK